MHLIDPILKKKALKRLNPMNAQLALATMQETQPSIILALLMKSLKLTLALTPCLTQT